MAAVGIVGVFVDEPPWLGMLADATTKGDQAHNVANSWRTRARESASIRIPHRVAALVVPRDPRRCFVPGKFRTGKEYKYDRE
jgi:hypothetical protein